MLHHWKIRNLENRKAYYVPIYQGINILDQLRDFMVDHHIKASRCRIIESSTRLINMSYREYVLAKLFLKG